MHKTGEPDITAIVFVGKVLYFLFQQFSISSNKIVTVVTDDYNLPVSTDVYNLLENLNFSQIEQNRNILFSRPRTENLQGVEQRSEMAQVLRLLAFIREVSVSNLGRDTDYSD